MADDEHFLNEARGIAFASHALVFSVITLLFKKGLMNKSEMDDLFEGVLETIENSPYANDPTGRIARGLIDGMAQIAATGGTLKPKADR
jgi:hypothetical protein